MHRYVLLRLAQLVPVLFVASLAIWALVYLLPGNPALAILGENATPAQVAALRAQLGLDQPVPVQYALWLDHVLHGDFGKSYRYGLSVTSVIGPRAIASLQLGVLAFVFSAVVGVPLGVLAAARPGGWAARFVAAYNSLTLAIPGYWLGILLILLFAVWLKVLPSASIYVPLWEDPAEAVYMSVLPVLTLGLYASGIIARFVRAAMAEVLATDYVRTARAKGVVEPAVVWNHGLRNALLPTITVLGLQLGAFIGGAVVTESVLRYPGLGTLLLTSVQQRDYPTAQAIILLIVVGFVVANLAVDVVYAWLDPRVRYS